MYFTCSPCCMLAQLVVVSSAISNASIIIFLLIRCDFNFSFRFLVYKYAIWGHLPYSWTCLVAISSGLVYLDLDIITSRLFQSRGCAGILVRFCCFGLLSFVGLAKQYLCVSCYILSHSALSHVTLCTVVVSLCSHSLVSILCCRNSRCAFFTPCSLSLQRDLKCFSY